MPDIHIDETKHKSERSYLQKIRDTFLGVIFGALLLQVIFFWFSTTFPSSIVTLFDNPLFLIYLGICGLISWFRGKNFIDWIIAKMGDWKFW